MRRAHDTPSTERAERGEQRSASRSTAAPANAVLSMRGVSSFDGLGNRATLALWRSGALQRKPRLSEPGDALEHEADRAADAVLSGDRPEHLSRHAAGGDLQRAATDEQQLAATLGLGPNPEEAQPRDADATQAADAAAAAASGGDTLDESTRSLMESRFGEDFSGVRIHSDLSAGQAAESAQAQAFTVGDHIVFGPGQFAPDSPEGQHLLAHELAHVVQQREQTGSVGDERETERDAQEAAHEVESGGTPAVRERAAPGTVQKQPKGSQGSSMPTHSIVGTTIVVDDIWMAYIMGGQGFEEEGKNWNPSTRTFSLRISVLGSAYKLEPYPDADAKARARNLKVALTSRNRFDGRTHTIAIGGPAKPSAKPPEPQPPGPRPEPTDEPKQEMKVEEPVETKAPPPGSQVTKVEEKSATDPQGALKEAGDLSRTDLTSMKPEPRKALLNAAAGAPPASTAPRLAHDLITTTPDRDAGALSDALHADGGKLLDDLKRNAPDAAAAATLADAVQDLDARRLDAPPPKTGRDFVEWTPDMQKKANEVREAMKRIGRRTPDLTEHMEGRPEWDRIKQWQDGEIQRDLRNLNREVSRWDAEHAPQGSAGIGSLANEEVKKALERVHAAKTITELFEARKQAKVALWRANQAMDAKRDLDRFESSVKAWNETQSGWATLASVPSHALEGVSSDRPNQIAAEARTEVNQALGLLHDATTPEEMARAANRLKQAIANANFQLSWHQDQVYGGAEKTIVGIKVVAITSAAVVAPQYVIPGFFIGGGLSAARQGVQIAEGTRKPEDFSGMEVFDSGVIGGFAAPFAAGAGAGGLAGVVGSTVTYGGAGLGVYSAGSEFSQGHGWTGAFDLATAALPFAIKSAPELGRWARPRVAEVTLRVALGSEPAGTGLSGRGYTPGLTGEPQVVLVDAASQPQGLAGLHGDLATPSMNPAAVGVRSTPQAAPTWRTASVGNSLPQPYGIPVVIRLADPVDAALSENSSFQVGQVHQVNRVRTTASGRQLMSLDVIALTPAQRQSAIAIHGQRLAASQQQAWTNATNARELTELVEINRLWNQGTPQSQQQARVLAREAFDRHRGRYWAAVRADAQLRAAFESAGMRFTGGNTTAPIYTLPDGTVARMTLEHSTRLADDPARALSGNNLQFVLNDENSVFLEFIRANDPFQR